jgi:hypothetical protein
MTDGQPASLSWCQTPICFPRPDFFLLQENCWFFIVGHTLWREGMSVYDWCWPSAVILWSESRGTCGNISLFHFETPQKRRTKASFSINRVPCYTPQAMDSLFVASYDTRGYGECLRMHLHAEMTHWPLLEREREREESWGVSERFWRGV